MEELLKNLDIVAVIVIITATTGAVELVKRITQKDWQAAATIAVSAAIGSLIALPVGIAWYIGLVLGLGASGLVTVASKPSKTLINSNGTTTINGGSGE